MTLVTNCQVCGSDFALLSGAPFKTAAGLLCLPCIKKRDLMCTCSLCRLFRSDPGQAGLLAAIAAGKGLSILP
jgi:hypothetical protein